MTGRVSEFIISACHNAPVVQTVEPGPLVYPVWCCECLAEAGTPGLEDIKLDGES